jgi:hypothetical protein
MQGEKGAHITYEKRKNNHITFPVGVNRDVLGQSCAVRCRTSVQYAAVKNIGQIGKLLDERHTFAKVRFSLCLGRANRQCQRNQKNTQPHMVVYFNFSFDIES